MSWQVEDADGNRQGLTIAEFGEAGRARHGWLPGRSGRPGPARGHVSAVRSADKTSQ